ncbi:hypothetical protein [Maribacter sp. 2307UL18-2]|uniref:hypothetical protein n=1 Tax=Maribacter sp. 2307UL18-2 TaxID=3386274 RepID=UPI0039BC2C2F
MNTIADLKQQPVAEHKLDLGRFVFYKNISISEVSEGTHVTFEKMADMLRIAENVYGNDTPFVYISNRIHSYSIDPLGYYEAIKLFPNLKAYAIVSQNNRRRTLAVLEKLFMKKPIRVFDDLEKAYEWAAQIIERTA